MRIGIETLPLHPDQATERSSIVNLPSGETADFVFTPREPGEFVLEISGPAPNLPPEGRVVFRVSPAGR